MGEYVFKLPDIGEGIAESEIAAWHVAVGDVVKEDQRLVDMLTDKAAVELGAPVTGKVIKLHGAAGDKIPVGSALVTLETSGASAAPDRGHGPLLQQPAKPVRAAHGREEPKPSGPAGAAHGREEPKPSGPAGAAEGREEPGPAVADDFYDAHPAAAPSVRQRARQMGVDLRKVRGSGPSGRVLHDDVIRHASGAAAPAVVAARAPAPVAEDKVEEIRIIGMRRKIAESMERSKRRIPHFAYVEELDVTELEALRVHLNEKHGKARGKLTLLPFLVKALVKAVPKFPNVNGTYDDEKGVFTRHSALNVGIAAQTPQGLVVPVMKNAQRLDLWQAAAEIARLAEAARAGKAKRDELMGSTITITSLGKMGGIASTPVINAPEVGIIGVNKLVERPVVRNGQIVIRSMMNLSSSFDHRIVDGYDAASFIQEIKALLEQPATLFID